MYVQNVSEIKQKIPNLKKKTFIAKLASQQLAHLFLVTETCEAHRNEI